MHAQQIMSIKTNINIKDNRAFFKLFTLTSYDIQLYRGPNFS